MYMNQQTLSEIRDRVEKLYHLAEIPPYYRPKVSNTAYDNDWTLVCTDDNYQLIMRQNSQDKVFTSSEELDECLFVMFKHIVGVMALEHAEKNPSETELRWEIRCRVLQDTLTKLNPEWGIRNKRSTEVFMGEHPLHQDARERDERKKS